MKGKLVTIRISPEIHKNARELGLNISKTCENALIEAVTKLERPIERTTHSGDTAGNLNLNLPPNPYIPMRVGSLARTGHETSRLIAYWHDPPKLGVAGSNPARGFTQGRDTPVLLIGAS